MGMDENTTLENEQVNQETEQAAQAAPEAESATALADPEAPAPEIAGYVDDLAIPIELPILPLKDVVIYPFSGVPLAVGQERSIKVINDAMVGNRLVGFVAQHDPSIEGAGPDEAFRVGTVGLILGMRRAANGTMQLAIQGLERFEIDEYTQLQPYLK